MASRLAWSYFPLLAVCLSLSVAQTQADQADPPKSEVETEVANSTGDKPTHKQSSLINVNADGLSQASVQCFCLMGDDALLAGCTGSKNELRVFNANGEFDKSIKIPVAPEAINIAADGTILVAGEGELLRLSAGGEVLTQVKSPHAAAIREASKQIREQVIEQHKQQAQMLPQMLESYDGAIKQLEKQIAALEEQENTEEQLNAAKEMLKTYESTKEQLVEQYGGEEGEQTPLTEEQIDEMVKSSIQYKIKVASISSGNDSVYIACSMPTGYGYAVWKMTPEFTGGEEIVSGLSGCCGQMDVQANDNGVFVAENSRKRVRRFDASGESICDWGKASEGVEGFGSCCNPMNLAFGTNGTVYTAEDTTGRIKRYSPEGELLSVVGAADVVPGCKKVSIGVDSTGDRVYMLDITRNNIAVLSRVLPDPTTPLATSTSSGGSLLQRLFGF